MGSPTLVILAAGMSTRFGGLKQVEPVGPSGETLLDYSIFDARRSGFGRVVLIIRPEQESHMRVHMTKWWPDLEVHYAFQEVAPGRAKPWGTAHAVLAALDYANGGLAVCNADDFYGRDAFRALGMQMTQESPSESTLVAYPLIDTLPEQGGVSRGVVEADADGRLAGLIELHDVRRTTGGARGVDAAGTVHEVPRGALASMNLWGLTPAMMGLLEQGSSRFIRGHERDPATEYPISTAIHDLVTAGRATVRVLSIGKNWMGITHPGDRDAVVARLAKLTRAGRYPSPVSGATRAPWDGSATK